MNSTAVVIDERGRVVLPAAVRERRHWHQGTELVLVKTLEGLLLAERSTLFGLLRDRLADQDLVGDLITERRAEAAVDSDAK